MQVRTKLDALKAYIHWRIVETHPAWIPAPARTLELKAFRYTGQIRQLQAACRLTTRATGVPALVSFTQPL